MTPKNLATVLGASALCVLVAAPVAIAQSFEDATAEAIFVQLNQYREQQGLSPLNDDGRLIDAAEIYTEIMAQNNVLSHTADGKSFDQRAADQGYTCASAENVA